MPRSSGVKCSGRSSGDETRFKEIRIFFFFFLVCFFFVFLLLNVGERQPKTALWMIACGLPDSVPASAAGRPGIVRHGPRKRLQSRSKAPPAFRNMKSQ